MAYRKNEEARKRLLERFRKALQAHQGDTEKAAKSVGYSRRTLQRAKKELGL